jgi:hypothetical protein
MLFYQTSFLPNIVLPNIVRGNFISVISGNVVLGKSRSGNGRSGNWHSTQISGLLFPNVPVRFGLYFGRLFPNIPVRFGPHFGRLFHKLIRSPWPARETGWLSMWKTWLLAAIFSSAPWTNQRSRVARFFLMQHTKTGKIYQLTKNIPNDQNLPNDPKYTKWP